MKPLSLALAISLVLMLPSCDKPAPKPLVTTTATTDSSFATTGKSNEQQDSARAVLERIFASAIVDDCAAIAPEIAFRGIGGEGDYKRACDYSKPDERVTVDKICAQVKVMIHDVVATEFEEYSLEEQKEGFWHVWKVAFDYADGKQASATFGLIEATGKLLLGDID